MFGFNHPNPGILENGLHGYEVWVTVPEDMKINAPMEKKKFPGGLYAVLTIPFPEFQLWENSDGKLKNAPQKEMDREEIDPIDRYIVR